MEIRPERLLRDLRELATIGKAGTGVNRPAFSASDMAARQWLRDRMGLAGLDAGLDRWGNVYGRMPGAERAVLLGSHSDTVPYGGWLDGSLGVIYALEIARVVAENGLTNRVGVDAISFQDEEGTFLALLGSRSFCGEEIERDAVEARNKDGEPLSEAVAKAGLGTGAPARLDIRRHVAYFEAHIEQGPRLEAGGQTIGVVSAIVGIRSLRIVFRGRADHAGTTPMAMRRDAGAAALKFGAAIGERLRDHGSSETVWNVGSADFKPGASNVVPSEAELVLQFRDPGAEVLEKLERVTAATAKESAQSFNADVDLACVLDTRPAAMDGRLAGLIGRAATDLGVSNVIMPSGAGHDAMVMARHLPSAMLFVPSIGGRSHHVSENTSEQDIVVGAHVLLRAVELFLQES